MTGERVDPRVARTKALLRESLHELMSSHRWEKIRVQDLLDHSGISRSAFYAHFDSKYDLLVSGIPETSIILSGDDGKVDLAPLFVHIVDVSPVMRPLLTEPVFGEIAAEFHRSMFTSWLELLEDTKHAGDETFAHMLAGALMALAKDFLGQRKREDPLVVAHRANDHFNRILNA